MSGLNINPLRDGYVGGLDHFGVVVDDIDTVLQRAREKFPQANIVKRPSTRPFANYSGHDPDGNIFDLAQKDEGDKLVGVYAEQSAAGWQPGPLSRQVRDPHHEPGEVRRLLSICVRAQAREPQRRRAATI